MNKKPLISIIVPVYNVEEYIERAVDSLKNQSIEDIEILLIDDGSSDNSGILCDKLAQEDNRIRVFHKKNGGVSSARNLGLDNAVGEYIGFCDPDDMVHRHMYQLMYTAIKDNKTMCAVCSIKSFTDISQISNTDFQSTITRLKDSEIIDYFLGNGRNLLGSLCNKLFHKSLIQNVRLNESMTFGEDYCFSLGLLLKCTSVSVLEKTDLYFYYRREDSAMKQLNSEKYYLLFCEKQKLFEQVKTKFKELNSTVESAYIRSLVATYLNVDNETKKIMNPIAKKNIKEVIRTKDIYWKEKILFIFTLLF